MTTPAPDGQAEAAGDATVAVPVTDGQAGAAGDQTVASPAPDDAAAPTLDTVQVQIMALDGVITPLTTLNATLQDAELD